MANTTNKGIEKPSYQQYNTDPTGWTVPINNNWDIIDNAFGGTYSVSLTNVDVTLTATQCQNARIYLSGSLSGNINIFFPSTISGLFVVADATTRNGYTISLKNAGAGVEFVNAVNTAYTFIWVDQATSGVYRADNAPVSGGTGINITSGSVINLTAPVSVANGGTGATTYTAGQLLIGNNAGGLTPATLTAGSNITVTNGNGAITIAATGSAGGVTTFQTNMSGLTPTTASAGAVTLAGTLGVASGGTGATDAATARSNLSAAGSGAITGSGLTLATSRLLGRTTAGTGAVEEISAGTGLSLSSGSIAISNSGVSAGTYTNATVTVDATGRVTSASSGSAGAVSSVSASSSASGFSLSASPSTGAVSVGFSISNDSNARSSLGLGSMATQNSNSVSISGGTISTSSTATFGAIRIGSSSFDVIGYSGGVAGLSFNSTSSIYGDGSYIVAAISSGTYWQCQSSNFTLGSGIGAFKDGGGTWSATSDARTKKDELPYTKSLNDLKTLNLVSYKYNGMYGTPNNNVTYYGLIAQEVLNTNFSDMVNTYIYTDNTTGQQTQLYSVDSSQLVYALINAVKELSARVETLEAKVP